jgi:hypothetical protein
MASILFLKVDKPPSKERQNSDCAAFSSALGVMAHFSLFETSSKQKNHHTHQKNQHNHAENHS